MLDCLVAHLEELLLSIRGENGGVCVDSDGQLQPPNIKKIYIKNRGKELKQDYEGQRLI